MTLDSILRAMSRWFCRHCNRHHDKPEECPLALLKHIERVVERIEHQQHTDHIILVDTSATALRIEDKVDALSPPTPPPAQPSLGGRVTAIYGRRSKMPTNIAVPKLLDVQKITLSVMPRKADGKVDTDCVVSWSSDSADVGTNPGTEPFVFTDGDNGDVTCPGAFNCEATTPGSTGIGNVTATGSSPNVPQGYDPVIFGPIEYAPGVPLSLNGSVGAPVSDL